MSIHAILFDKDGTLLNYQAFWFPVAQATVDLILKQTGGDPAWSGDLLRSIDLHIPWRDLQDTAWRQKKNAGEAVESSAGNDPGYAVR